MALLSSNMRLVSHKCSEAALNTAVIGGSGAQRKKARRGLSTRLPRATAHGDQSSSRSRRSSRSSHVIAGRSPHAGRANRRSRSCRSTGWSERALKNAEIS